MLDIPELDRGGGSLLGKRKKGEIKKKYQRMRKETIMTNGDRAYGEVGIL